MITITENASIFLKAIMDQDERKKAFLLTIERNSYSYPKYGFSFIEEVSDENSSFTINELLVAIPSVEEHLFKGTVIDYKQTANGSGFTIENPNSIMVLDFVNSLNKN